MNSNLLTRMTMVLSLTVCATSLVQASDQSYNIVDTLQTTCSDLTDEVEICPAEGQSYYGQDAQYSGNQPSYTKNNDGTVTDDVTGLIWNPVLDHNGDGKIGVDDKVTYEEAFEFAKASTYGGYDDWRVPTIKELYSLMHFDGQDPSFLTGAGTFSIMPFIDHSVFGYGPGDTENNERLIDSQYVSATKYVSTTMPSKDETVFGVNFIDGRIKGYGMKMPFGGEDKEFYILLVRGNPDYGINKFVDQDNGTILDEASGLSWQKGDSKDGMDWTEALNYCETLTIDDNSDWRLPNLKELQSIIDYSRSPDTTNSPAIDPIFETTQITNEGGQADYGNYWSSTTHYNISDSNGEMGGYMSFGRSVGYMGGQWTDVHGAGSQRSDPKEGDASQWPQGHGPQGDSIRIDNMVRCVSGGAEKVESPEKVERESYEVTLTGNERSVMSQGKMPGRPE